MIMIIDTSFLKKIKDLSLGQLVFLNLVADKSNNNQETAAVIKLITENEIQDLVQRNLLSLKKDDSNITYNVTEQFKKLVGETEEPFEQFCELYPAIVIRPDGTKGFLKTNLNKCRIIYKQTIGKSIAMHRHIMTCLQHEIDDKMSIGKMGYMKTMYKWLTSHEWEVAEQQMKDGIEPNNKNIYGTELI